MIKKTMRVDMAKNDNDPLRQADIERRLANMAKAPRCGARTRAGSPCRQAAVKGRARCRMHGDLEPSNENVRPLPTPFGGVKGLRHRTRWRRLVVRCTETKNIVFATGIHPNHSSLELIGEA